MSIYKNSKNDKEDLKNAIQKLIDRYTLPYEKYVVRDFGMEAIETDRLRIYYIADISDIRGKIVKIRVSLDDLVKHGYIKV